MTITAIGSGVAIIQDLPDPSANPPGIHFGAIGRGSAQQATIQVTAVGDIASSTIVALQSASGDPLFSLSDATIALDGGGAAGSATLSCGSDTAGSASATISLTTAGAFAGGNLSFPVDCTVADTFVTAAPTMFGFGSAFGELRRDANAMPFVQTITLTNAGTATSPLGTVTMQPSTPHLVLTQPPPSVDGSATATFQITVDPDATNSSGQTFDEDLDATPLVVTIPVDSTALTVTVTGKIVKATTALAPAPPAVLDLGTVCLGGSASGMVTLTDTGTAHVAAMAPSIGSGWTLAGGGSSELAPAAAQAIAVSPTDTGKAGEIDGTLAWMTDVPSGSGMSYQLATKVVVVPGGLGVSPNTIAYPLQAKNITSVPQTIDVENCDAAVLVAKVGNVIPNVGPASAWQVASPGMYSLQPGQLLTVEVAFAPPRGGHFDAELPITTGSNTTLVELTGEPPRERARRAAENFDQSQTDFYACGCHGGGTPTQGWPVVAVVVVVARRRRRRATLTLT